jgi:hypothetical protein
MRFQSLTSLLNSDSGQNSGGTKPMGPGLTKTLEVPNTITVGNSLSFSTVHQMTLVNRRFVRYDC